MEQFRTGDRLRHPNRPDWGVGVVLKVHSHVDGGRRGQRLTLRFDGVGVKTISTLLVPLEYARSGQDLTVASLSELPADLSEGGSPMARLERALAWYRFDEHGRALLDWAIARSGARDPLAQLTRQDLEQAYAAFYRRLDFQVRELAGDLRRSGAGDALETLIRAAPARARALLEHNGRR